MEHEDITEFNLLEPGPEAGLHANFVDISAKVRESADYKSNSNASPPCAPAVDLFFDKVMVNVDNPEVRQIGSRCFTAY